ncbi:hypothetical protein HY439_03080 [Candidatus Microgenomates bacterium]|nr:hypothetical protein [Candidatus Microgenomates bacterium]
MKISGHRASHRNRWLLLKNGVLAPQEFLLFEFYLDSMDFDLSHENFGLFVAFTEETKQYFNKEEETIKDWHNGLLNKGFIELVNKKREIFRIKSPKRYVTAFGGKANEFAKSEKNTPTLDFILQNICFSPEKTEINPLNNTVLALKDTSKALGSSKGKYRVPFNDSKKVVLISQSVRSEADYLKIRHENNFQNLSTEDMRWIDENVREKVEIEDDQQEKDVVNVFFDGNWDEYRKHLITS